MSKVQIDESTAEKKIDTLYMIATSELDECLALKIHPKKNLHVLQLAMNIDFNVNANRKGVVDAAYRTS